MIGIALLILTAFTLWFSSAVLTRILRVRSVTATLLSWITIAYAQIILVSLTVSWPSGLNEYSLAGAHALIALATAFVWSRGGRPRLLPDIGRTARRFCIITRSDWCLSLLTAAVTLAAGLNIFLILYVPPNNWDAMTCHLARAAFWMQYERVGDFPSHNSLHNDYPMGASIALMYTLIFIRSNLLPGFVQFGAWLGSFACIYGIARQFGFRPAACVHSALVALLLPLFVMQASSAQIDLLFAMSAGLAVYFLLLALRTDRIGPLILASIGMALMFATKGTTPLLGPLFITCLLGWSVLLSRRPIRFVARYCAACVCSVALLGAESYVSNLWRYHALSNPSEQSPASGRNDLEQVRANLIRFAVSAFELPFDPPYNFTLDVRRARIVRWLGSTLDVDVENVRDGRSVPLETIYYRMIEEDIGWYGLVGFLLYPLVCLFATEWLALRPPATRRRRLIGGIFAGAVVSAVTLSFLLAATTALLATIAVLRWHDPRKKLPAARWLLAANIVGVVLMGAAIFKGAGWNGRFFMPVVLFSAAITPVLYNRRRWICRFIARTAVIVVVVQAVIVVTHNGRKPLIPSFAFRRLENRLGTIFDLNRERRLAIVRPIMGDLARAVDSVRPPIRRLGYVSNGGDNWDFPFFGDRLERELVLIDSKSDWLSQVDAQKLNHVLLLGVPHEIPFGFRALPLPPRNHTSLLERVTTAGRHETPANDR